MTMKLPPLPEPHNPHASPLAFAQTMLGETYSAEQMQAYARAAQRIALEEAAKACSRRHCNAVEECAAVIRDLLKGL